MFAFHTHRLNDGGQKASWEKTWHLKRWSVVATVTKKPSLSKGRDETHTPHHTHSYHHRTDAWPRQHLFEWYSSSLIHTLYHEAYVSYVCTKHIQFLLSLSLNQYGGLLMHDSIPLGT